jgi:hypothetical protein
MEKWPVSDGLTEGREAHEEGPARIGALSSATSAMQACAIPGRTQQSEQDAPILLSSPATGNAASMALVSVNPNWASERQPVKSSIQILLQAW